LKTVQADAVSAIDAVAIIVCKIICQMVFSEYPETFKEESSLDVETVSKEPNILH
jgi:hypothetical protein